MTSDKPVSELVPTDFPRSCGGSVSGAQNKLIVRKVDGRFVDGMTDEELWVRYEACQHLATKLTEHASRERSEYAELSFGDFLRRLRAGAVKKGWDLTSEELDWVMGRVAVTLGGSLEDALYRITVDANWIGALSTSTNPPVESLIDRVRAKLEQ